MSTKVTKCNCQSDFQDRFYGKNMRLFNLKGDGNKGKCTICGKETNI